MKATTQMDKVKFWSRQMKMNKNYKSKFIRNIFNFIEMKKISSKTSNNTIFLDMIFYNAIDVNMVCPNDDTGDTLLHRAAACANCDAVAILLNAPNIDITIKNKAGLTPPEVICTKIRVSGNYIAKFIQDDKNIHSRYTLLNEDYISCQDPTFFGLKTSKRCFFTHKNSVRTLPKLLSPKK